MFLSLWKLTLKQWRIVNNGNDSSWMSWLIPNLIKKHLNLLRVDYFLLLPSLLWLVLSRSTIWRHPIRDWRCRYGGSWTGSVPEIRDTWTSTWGQRLSCSSGSVGKLSSGCLERRWLETVHMGVWTYNDDVVMLWLVKIRCTVLCGKVRQVETSLTFKCHPFKCQGVFVKFKRLLGNNGQVCVRWFRLEESRD